jgi:hypothetical protein
MDAKNRKLANFKSEGAQAEQTSERTKERTGDPVYRPPVPIAERISFIKGGQYV